MSGSLLSYKPWSTVLNCFTYASILKPYKFCLGLPTPIPASTFILSFSGVVTRPPVFISISYLGPTLISVNPSCVFLILPSPIKSVFPEGSFFMSFNISFINLLASVVLPSFIEFTMAIKRSASVGPVYPFIWDTYFLAFLFTKVNSSGVAKTATS